jgi:hypothetical protein
VPSSSHLAAWNAASTYFYVVSNQGTVLPFSFDASTMTAARVQVGGTPAILPFAAEPQFSLADPNVIFGIGGSNNRTIRKVTFPALTAADVLNLDTVVPGLTGFVGTLISGRPSAETLVTMFGGGCQDRHHYALWYPLASPGTRKLLDTTASTLNGAPLPTPLGFHLHSLSVDLSGRFVTLYPAANENPACGQVGPRTTAEQVYVWDTAADSITAVTASQHPFGHDALGHGYWVNQDCCSNPSPYDAAQWQFRSLTDLAHPKDLIVPVLTTPTTEVYWAEHSTWNNARPGVLVPFISSTYRRVESTVPWRAWDNEIIAVQTDVAPGAGATIWRIAQHQSDTANAAHTAEEFWYQPIANVSPDGRWAIFTSNWQKTLGNEMGSGGPSGLFRQDVFLVCLTVGSCPGD